jgi:hypothetical protein
MHAKTLRRSIPLVIALLLAACTGSAALAAKPKHPVVRASSLAGTWSGQYSGAFNGTFTLHWTQAGSILRGSITLSRPHGTYGIGGSVHGTAINFGAVGVGATYTGSVSGKSMAGHWRSGPGGGTWSAHKTS